MDNKEELTRADYDNLILSEENGIRDEEDAFRLLDMDKELMEVCLRDLAKAKEKYEKAIENGDDMTKVTKNLKVADDLAYHQATDFYKTIIDAQEFLIEAELEPYWIVWRKYFEI